MDKNDEKYTDERFAALIQREPFDYTKWQRELWKDKTVEEISREAMEFRKKRKDSKNQVDVETKG